MDEFLEKYGGVSGRKVSTELEDLPIEHLLSEEEVDEILEERGLDLSEPRDKAKLYTLIRRYEDNSRVTYPTWKRPESLAGTDPNIPYFPEPFGPGVKEYVALSLFFIPKSGSKSMKKSNVGSYRYIPILIAPSKIPNAGNGAFALEDIPKGARAVYRGIAKTSAQTNSYFSWTIKTHSEKTGKQDYRDKSLFFIDAEDVRCSNWTRFANCALKREDNNFSPIQHFATLFYSAKRLIKKGSELMIDYGVDYAVEHLKIPREEYDD